MESAEDMTEAEKKKKQLYKDLMKTLVAKYVNDHEGWLVADTKL